MSADCVWCGVVCGVVWCVVGVALQSGSSTEAVQVAQRIRLEAFPEHAIKDMATWFGFIVGSRPNLLQGLEVGD